MKHAVFQLDLDQLGEFLPVLIGVIGQVFFQAVVAIVPVRTPKGGFGEHIGPLLDVGGEGQGPLVDSLLGLVLRAKH